MAERLTCSLFYIIKIGVKVRKASPLWGGDG